MCNQTITVIVSRHVGRKLAKSLEELLRGSFKGSKNAPAADVVAANNGGPKVEIGAAAS